MTQPLLKTQHMQIGGMDCASCAGKIEAALQKLAGVAEVSVSAATGRLSISYDREQIQEAQIRDRIMALGYTLISPIDHTRNATQPHGCSDHGHAHHPDHDRPDHRHPDHRHPDHHSSDHQHDHQHDHHSSAHQHGSGESAFDLKRELPIVLIVLALLIAGMTFEKSLQATPFRIGEYAVYLSAYLLSGWSVLQTAGRNIRRGQIFDETFLMTIATLGAIAIHQLPEAVAVMLFYKIGELFQEAAVHRSRRSILSLLAIRPDVANLKTDAGIQSVSPEQVQIGEVIIVRPGEKIPLDGDVVDGQSQVDTSALTGESVPRSIKPEDTVLAGMVNQSGVLTIRVTKRFSESSIVRILELVEHATNKKAKPEKFITRFAQRYTPVVVFLSLAVALLPPFFIPGATHSEWVYRALTLLVISCPCGLVISIPLGYFGGVGGAAKRGVLVKGSMFLDALAAVKTVVFDKTGTLTKGVFNVVRIEPYNGFSQTDVLRWAATAEYHSNHPIAQSIRRAYAAPIEAAEIADYHEIAGVGVRATVRQFPVLVGNDRLLHQEHIAHDTCGVTGTIVHVAINQVYAGYLEIADQLKDDAPHAIAALKQIGVAATMLTGDSKAAAERVAQALDLTAFQAELLPEDKVTALEMTLWNAGKHDKVAFAGDGINDAPSIARADVGIAMGGLGSDAAIETADVVIMTDAPSKVAEAIQIGRKTRQIVWQNIGLALVIKGVFIGLGILGYATLWEAVFADIGVALLAIFNALRVIR